MQLTKFGHACVRIEKDGRRLVVDPGGLTEPRALDGASAVLVTHEHFDHFCEATLRRAAGGNPALRIWANTSVAAATGRPRRPGARGRRGRRLHRAGLRCAGARDLARTRSTPTSRASPTSASSSTAALFHPGDALTVPDSPVDTLLLPYTAPGPPPEAHRLRTRGGPARVQAIHDGALNDMGRTMLAGLLGANGPGTGTIHRRLAAGASADLG